MNLIGGLRVVVRSISAFSARGLFLLLLLVAQGCGAMAPMGSLSVSGETRDGLLCHPKGSPPFPAVVYSHGVIVDSRGYAEAVRRGYDLRGICESLAKDGFLAFVPIRSRDPSLGVGRTPKEAYSRLRKELSKVLDYVKALPDVNPSRIALMGHSMGGLLTLLLGTERKDLKALIVSAPAPHPGVFPEVFEKADWFTAPLLLLVEAGEEDPRILANVEKLGQSLKDHGKDVRVIRYDRGGGHELFFTVSYYWDDVRNFLRARLDAP